MNGTKDKPYIIRRITRLHISHRLKQMKNGKNNTKNIKLHAFFHNRLIPLISVSRKLRKQELTIMSDNSQLGKCPTIYACTHIGGFDIENLFEAIKAPCWLFLADPNEVYVNFDGLLLFLNGVICFESDNKTDRNIGVYKY